MKTPVIAGIVLAAAVLAALIYTSFGNRHFRCEVCVAYGGHNACRKASAATKEQALRSATDNACAQVASGVTATMVCESAQPVSVSWLN
jgi:hypothetical protein